LINTDAVDVLAQHAARTNSLLVHYSTDYVFDGENAEPYTESDEPNPQSVYGKTKLDGELAIQASGCDHLIFRTSWVYSATGTNFVKTIRGLAMERDELNIVDDQFGAPTSASLIARVTAEVLSQFNREKGTQAGLYHLAAAGETSWYQFAEHFLDADRETGASRARIRPIPTASYPTKARRPLNSRLDTSKLRGAFGVELPDWRVDVDLLLATMRLQETP
jgi:dTDP-4-dehydrorhamnose reductase